MGGAFLVTSINVSVEGLKGRVIYRSTDPVRVTPSVVPWKPFIGKWRSGSFQGVLFVRMAVLHVLCIIKILIHFVFW